MRTVNLLLMLSLVTAFPARAVAQHGTAANPITTNAPREATQFAFLVGQWELTVTPKATSLGQRIHGAPKLSGTWKAWRAFDGFGVEDELRIVDGSGNPYALFTTLRTYDATRRKWAQTSLDVYRARFTPGTSEWRDDEMVVRSTGRDAEGTPYVQRARFYDITAGGFKYQIDRSTDGERTWDTAVLRIEAKRVSATAPR
jgi:hypothetical protein